MHISLRITDDSGFLAVLNAARYTSYVDLDWELDQLIAHFLLEMNSRNLIIWGTGLNNYWDVTVVDTPTERPAFREFTQPITITDGKLYLTNYEDLTMAAQFEDQPMPSSHNANNFIALPNGDYKVTVRQIGDPTDLKTNMEELSFELVVQQAVAAGLDQEITQITWFEK